jgi:hypothetical protein
MVPQFEINLAKILGPIESIQQIINAKQMIVILYGYFVSCIVINAHFQLVVPLVNKQN